MADEVLFIDKKGEETYLPESVGEKMGFERAQDNYVPAELKEGSGSGEVEDVKRSIIGRINGASVVIIGASATTYDELNETEKQVYDSLTPIFDSITLVESIEGDTSDVIALAVGVINEYIDANELNDQQADLMGKLIAELIHRPELGVSVPVEGQQEQTGGASLVDAVRAVEEQLKADTTKTPQQKGSIQKYLTELLTTQTDAPAGDGKTE